MTNSVEPEVAPSGTGCVECLADGGWWLHLRRCAECGHVGCCDNSLGKHATAHAHSSGHPVIRSFEPGEDWFWNYRTDDYMDGPGSHPRSIIRSTSLFQDQPDESPPTGKNS